MKPSTPHYSDPLIDWLLQPMNHKEIDPQPGQGQLLLEKQDPQEQPC